MCSLCTSRTYCFFISITRLNERDLHMFTVVEDVKCIAHMDCGKANVWLAVRKLPF